MAEIRRPPSIDAYGGGGFRVSGERVEGSILILNDQLRPWPVASREALGVEDIAEVLAAGSRTVLRNRTTCRPIAPWRRHGSSSRSKTRG